MSPIWHYRLGQNRLPWRKGLLEAGIPIIETKLAVHAVYVDAGRMLPHIPHAEFPGQALDAALYLEGGIRGVEIGFCKCFGLPGSRFRRNGFIPNWNWSDWAIPRRVYTQRPSGLCGGLR